MQFHNGSMNIVQNPLIYNLFYENFQFLDLIPPPGSSFIITETGVNIISENGDLMIKE